MAKPGYWADQFRSTLPRYLAKWYVAAKLDSIEASCRRHGIKSLMKFTGGFYSADKIGCWICSNNDIIGHIYSAMKKSSDPMVRDMYDTVVGYSPRHFEHNLHEALIEETGKVIQDTLWWRENIDKIRRLARKTRIIIQVMES